MRLDKLTISGFKSFAKATTLEFPAAVNAIVGPNGSGKSNVAEAIRWVLGEQSLKTLRGKRGEDLIFNGSANSPRMGKAAVTLTFDNHDHAIAVDFDMVALERKIFRDGASEYFLNGSQVRLRDIVELIARMGLGETKHNIIGQGEVDRVLSSSPKERRDILEETIGLGIYKLRKKEAARKLEETTKNMLQAEVLLKEIRPHLKFLKIQAERAEKREIVERELEDYYRAYITGEEAAIAAETAALEKEASPSVARLKTIAAEISELASKMSQAEKNGGAAGQFASTEKEIENLELKRREFERELGRVEGRLEIQPPPAAVPAKRSKPVEASAIEEKLKPILEVLKEIAILNDVANIKARAGDAAKKIEEIISGLEELRPSAEPASPPAKELEERREHIQKEIVELDRELTALRQDLAREIEQARKTQVILRAEWQNLREREEEANALRARLQRIEFEKEKISLRREESRRLIYESGMNAAELKGGQTPFSGLGRDELKKKIEKLKVRLEEIGGIDEVMLKEYRDTKTRYEFLARELGDLATAERDLRQLVKELEDRIENDFKKGFAKIKEEFHNYFRIIFGGGKGAMSYLPLAKSRPEEGDDGADDRAGDKVEYGIEIDVDIPRKKIKGLAMLSGGERALVSIAILFAITAVNPPPFLVLDETDAALDEANSQKYGALLKELSGKTQLILITHNRETMKQAGVLYGVTMGEDGISKILSLKLEEAESYGNH